jgi:phosphatidylserine/phosphatidylglycerophosphate/cardiolipin synthase-like enzyme
MPIADWFLNAGERGNGATALDDRHPPGEAWSQGNLVRPLVHGATYFAELAMAIERMRAGDLLVFADWRGDPDERLTSSEDSGIGHVLSRAASRGVVVRGLVWRSHWDRLTFSADENRHLGEEINQAGGCCLLDMRVRTGGSHHQKFLVLRHPGRPELDIAFLGGIDLCHSRRDDADHQGDTQRQPMAKVYGERPPWHDIQLAITGPAVADVETVFRERWVDPQPLSRDPARMLGDRIHHDDQTRAPLPPQLPPPPPTGPHCVQLLRTYGRRRGGYPFAPHGERSVARGYLKALGQARELIYVEDQYLWSRDVGRRIADRLRAHPRLHLIAVLPHHPDQDGRLSLPPNIVGRQSALSVIRAAAPDRVAVYGIENHAGTPVYVHAKVCVIDDQWASVGSDNFNRRSWTHDSELSAAVWDTTPERNGADNYARDLRMALAREHLDNVGEHIDPRAMFDTFTHAATALQRWHDDGRQGPRPPGRLRPLVDPQLSMTTRLWAWPLYRTLYDPDSRPPLWRLRGRY